ncbi:MAG: hypothetical protein DWQ37_17710 [Planctomycetota bacterium]|nr:MAG: hypothetical protein DWQ37_17710 [Planctomycetota bacterium]
MHFLASGFARLARGLTLSIGLLLAGLMPAAEAQIIAVPSATPAAGGGQIPSQLYFNALPNYYNGNYQDSLALFRNEARNGIKTVNSQWIDAIPYYTMAGECYYQLGQMPAALENYDAALKLYVAYSDWMMRVQFPQNIAAARNAVRATPWGQSKRGAPAGAFAETYLMGQGQIDQTQVARQGGVIQAAVAFPVNVAEIVRATCLAIRRRRDLMGPVCKEDPLTQNVVDVLSRRPGPPNHWSEAWVNVQLGCAFAAAGSLPQAKTALERGLLVAGQFDHPLTSTALLELARLAMEDGDYPQAMNLCQEASYACANFPNPTNLEEAFRMGSLAHLLLNQKGPYPPIGPALNWSRTQAPRHLHASLLLLAAENMAVLHQVEEAAEYLKNARVAMGRSSLTRARLGAEMNYLSALVSYQMGNVPGGDQSLGQALQFQQSGSLWAFQIALADKRYVSGHASNREASLLYEQVLRDPTPADWRTHPLECHSVLHANKEAALEHWFELSMDDAKQQEQAVQIADRARRHRFYSTLPMGGRLIALRWILEGPVEALGDEGLLQRQNLLAHYPQYAKMAERAAQIRTELAAKPLVAAAADAKREQEDQLAALEQVSRSQEVVLREIALRREPADMVFPPLRSTTDVQQSLPPGHVVLAFFATKRDLYAFLFSNDRFAAWQVRSPVQLRKQVTDLLREIGNFDANHALSQADLSKSNWRTSASKVTDLLLDRSNVELTGGFEEIVIVPDDMLWYLPFETLIVGPPDRKRPLISLSRVRYTPTVGLAVEYGAMQKPRPNVGVALGRLHPQDDDTVAAEAFRRFAPAVAGAVALPHPLTAPSNVYRVMLDGLIVLDDVEPADGPYAWAPLQADRGKTAAASLESWLSLPWGGPQQMILPGFHTAAESGIRKGRPDGSEVFLSVCGLMSAGVRTVLISRWRTAGQTSIELVREYAQELPFVPPANAWQRSVQVVSDATLAADREPRIKKASPGAARLRAGHPFFWSGYMLVDGGASAGSGDPTKLPADPAAPGAQPANPPVGGPRPQPANPRVNGAVPRSILGGGRPGAPVPGQQAAPAADPPRPQALPAATRNDGAGR